MRYSFVFMCLALVGCGSSAVESGGPSVPVSEPTSDSYDSFVSQNEFCESTGTSMCARSNQCGIIADDTVDKCLTAYRDGCCGVSSNGVDDCANGTVTTIRQSKMNACSAGLGAMSCDDVDKMLSAPTADTIPSECHN